MENKSQNLENLEKSIWQIVLLAVVVILFLTLALLGVQFYNYLEDPQSTIFTKGSYKYFVFLSIIILLFCSYMVTQHRRLSQLARDFLREKDTVQMLSQDVKTLSALFEVSASISSQQDLDHILHAITNEIVSCFDADHASLMLLDEETNMIETQASVGKDMELVRDAVIPVGESIAGYVVKHGKPVLLNGQVDPKEFPGTQKKDRNITSSMCVPLTIGDRGIGVLNLNLIDRHRTFTKRDLELIAIFANNAAVAINDAKLYEQIKLFNVQLEEKVRERTRELETANQVKSNFLAGISHELRTPLNAIIGFAEVLLGRKFGELNAQQQKYLNNIAVSGRRLNAIIDDILDVSRLEAGDFKLKITPVDVKKIMETAADRFKKAAEKRKINVDLHIPEDSSDLTINADENKIKQVVNHLLANAVKFTPANGSVALAAQRVAGSELRVPGSGQIAARDAQPAADDFIEISVSDNGIGIATQNQKEIFKEFFQVKGGLSNKTSGTGMGLSLSKRLVELHGGNLWVESTGEGQGSRFAFVLPLNV